MKDGNNYILVDICGTVFRSNTTIDFLRFVTPGCKMSLMIKLIRTLPIRLINFVFYRCFHYDISRRFLLKRLKGKSRKELQTAADNFYLEYLKPRINEEVDLIIKQKANKKIILISGTLNIIAECIAKHYNAETYIASELEFDANGKCTGKLKYDILDRKHTKITSLGIKTPFNAILTDNIGDINIINLCKEKYIVIYDNQKQWDNIDSLRGKCYYIFIDKQNWYIR